MAARHTTKKVRGQHSEGSKSLKTLSFKGKRRKPSVTLMSQVETFSKLITKAYLLVWIEVVVYTQYVTLQSFGDSMSIQSMFTNVTELGKYVFAFYFSTKVIENVSKGIVGVKSLCDTAADPEIETAEAYADNADADSAPAS